MSRFSEQHSYGHDCRYCATHWGDYYQLFWTVDHYVSGSRLRFPTVYHRDTDERGARRFCKRWGIDMPTKKLEATK